MHLHYLEIVTGDVDGVCAAQAATQGLCFGSPDARLGQARTAALPGGGTVGVRAPLHPSETPVVRPYWRVDDLAAAVAAAVQAGGEVIHPPLAIPGLGSFALHALGGNHHGLWQL
jgi:uncharacterized protein